jgi:hypothetical protein
LGAGPFAPPLAAGAFAGGADADFATGFTGDAAFAAGFGAGLGAGFFAGGALAFDFVAVFDAITVLCAAREAAIAKRGSASKRTARTNQGRKSGTGCIKPRLTLFNQPNLSFPQVPRGNSPLPYVRSLGFFAARSKRAHRAPGRAAKTVDQGLRALQSCQTGLDVLQPGEVLLARLGPQGHLGVFELFM